MMLKCQELPKTVGMKYDSLGTKELFVYFPSMINLISESEIRFSDMQNIKKPTRHVTNP